jgi:hypothetical protein
VGDADSGSNDFQNYPVLTSATTSAGGTTTIGGKLSSNSFEAFKIQFYSNPSGEEGKRFIGEKTVVALVGGQVSFTFTPSQTVAVGQNFHENSDEVGADELTVKLASDTRDGASLR